MPIVVATAISAHRIRIARTKRSVIRSLLLVRVIAMEVGSDTMLCFGMEGSSMQAMLDHHMEVLASYMDRGVRFATADFTASASSSVIGIRPFSARYPSSPTASSLVNSARNSSMPGTTPTCAFLT